ncbi:26S proteasome non-ATPase regulatory subunit 6-like protein [Drosera capensis]
MEGEDGNQNPHLILANNIFLLNLADVPDIEKLRLKEDVFAAIRSDYMVSLYEKLVRDRVFEMDQALLESMRAAVEEQLKKLDEKIADAEENLGESEVREAHLAKSLFYVRIGDDKNALDHLKVTESKTVAVGQKMDLVFYTLQIGFFNMDFDLISKSIDKAKNLFEEGGDWERKNRLKVYEGLYCMSTRNFKKAASLLLDSISTFTTYDMFSYDTFIFYTVLTSVISLDRVSLKQKVVDAPEILTVIGKIPFLSEFLNSLYDCRYKEFFSAFAGLTEQIKLDRYLHPHFRYYMREVRTVVYSQFLESYKSVTIDAMARAFGVSVDFIDHELSRFIAAGRLHCKIDKVAGVLETNRPDAKNALYQATIKQGDFLLNRIQKLSRREDDDSSVRRIGCSLRHLSGIFSSTTHKPHSNSHHLLRNYGLNLSAFFHSQSHHYNLPLVVSHTKPPLLPRLVAYLEQVEKSYIMVKPDGVQRGLVGEIIYRFEKKGFKLIGLKTLPLPQTTSRGVKIRLEHYKDLKSRPFSPTLTEYITSGPVVCMIIWSTNPLQAEPGTIRGDLAVQTGRNVVHGSESPENGEREIGLWFKEGELCEWTPAQAPWMRE